MLLTGARSVLQLDCGKALDAYGSGGHPIPLLGNTPYLLSFVFSGELEALDPPHYGHLRDHQIRGSSRPSKIPFTGVVPPSAPPTTSVASWSTSYSEYPF